MSGNAASIRKLRTSLGWTQAQLASALGVDAVTVSRWERGIASPRRRHLALMDEFGSRGAVDRAPVQVGAGRLGEISDDPSIDELVRFVGLESARRALRKMALLKRKPTPVRFLVDPATRLREVDAALREQTELMENAKIG